MRRKQATVPPCAVSTASPAWAPSRSGLKTHAEGPRGNETPKKGKVWVTAQTGQDASPTQGRAGTQAQEAEGRHTRAVYEGQGCGGGWAGESEPGSSRQAPSGGRARRREAQQAPGGK